MRWIFPLVIACGHPPPAPQTGSAAAPVDAAVALDAGPLDRDLNRLAERSVVLYDDILGVLTAAGEDCGAAAAKLDAVATKHADVIAANAKVLQDGRQVQLKIALRRFDERFQNAARLIVQSKTLAACWKDSAFARSLDRLVGGPPT